MSTWKVKVSLCLNYFVFAILLNSVGIVILQVINIYGVSEQSASVLEAFKDLSIAFVSFFIASFLPRIGYKKSMLIGLTLVTVACFIMPFLGSFLMTKVLFATVGTAFALIKVSVYSTVGLITRDSKEHASFMSTIEGIFMVGVLSGYWIFGFFMDNGETASSSWLNVYWVLGALSAAAFLLLYSTQLDEQEIAPQKVKLIDDFLGMLKLAYKPLVFVFIISAFLYVVLEQGIGTWLPTFNNKVLQLPDTMSVQIVSIFAASTALGRLLAGVVFKKIHWFKVLATVMIAMMALVILTLPLTQNITPGSVTGWSDAPIAAYIFPMIGLFLAPIYPSINSVILSSLPKRLHSAMTGLIVIFSALGGTSGSLITGFIFGRYDGQTAFYFTLVPMVLLLGVLYVFNKFSKTFEITE